MNAKVDAWLGLRPAERWPYGRMTSVEEFRAARSRLMEGCTVDPFFGPGEVLPIPECLAKRDLEFDLSPLWTVGEVIAEAQEMVNCISESNYLGPMRLGKTVAYSIRRPERATLVIMHSGEHGWFLHDLAGPQNEPASGEMEVAVRKWCERHGIQYLYSGDWESLKIPPQNTSRTRCTQKGH